MNGESKLLDGIDAATALHHWDELEQAVVTLAKLARHDLALMTPALGSGLYDGEAFYNAVSSLLRGNARSRMRLLLTSTASLRAARLLSLAHRLPSHIEIRRAPEDSDASTEMLIADERSYLLRLHAQRNEAELGRESPHRAQQLGTQFNELWEASEPDAESRRLSL